MVKAEMEVEVGVDVGGGATLNGARLHVGECGGGVVGDQNTRCGARKNAQSPNNPGELMLM
jgi:hypothetical protein